jgi:hypothetical protein
MAIYGKRLMEKKFRNKKVLMVVTETQFKKLSSTILDEEKSNFNLES